MRNILSIQELNRIAIVGVGLLGGSLGMAVRAAGSRAKRIGIGRRQSSLDLAMSYDAVDEVTLDVASGVREADLVVVCTPIGVIEDVFRAMAPHLRPECLVTDVASTKAKVVRAAERILGRKARYVGSHPIAGSEKTSVEFARADLFQAAGCVITPTQRSHPGAVEDVVAFWRALGAHPHILTPAEHDRAMARVSHLPHAVAAALVLLAGDAIRYAGPGFGDTTRIASGDPALWRDIFATNRPAALKALDELGRQLRRFRRVIEARDGAALEAWLAKAQAVRDEWVRRRYAEREIQP